MTASLSLLRPRSRCSSTVNDGGSTKIETKARPHSRTCCAPCTSITSTTSRPAESSRSVSGPQVPYRLPKTSAHSRNSPAAIIASKRSRATKW